ncbi:MAG: uroporphyrinogen decarboxylase [Coriobacteriia bacterium]
MPFNDLFLRACRREPVERTPIWMMRQAGRYLAEYRAIRERHSFLEMCKTPEIAAEVTIQPVDLVGVDAAILFADILLPLEGMGLGLDFVSGKGPVIHGAIRSAADVERLTVADPIETTGYVMDAIRILRDELRDKVPLIGFSGAPFTLASYMIEGGSTRDFALTKAFMLSEPAAWERLMTVTTETLALYLEAQIEAGAQAVQVFDSWVGNVAPDDYAARVRPFSAELIARVSGKGVPVIHFANNAGSMLDLVVEAGGDVVGVDWRVPMRKALEVIPPDKGVQGNIDPMALFAPEDVIERKVVDILEAVGTRPGHIFNLGHGIHKTTDPDKARALVRLVHEHSERIRSGVK